MLGYLREMFLYDDWANHEALRSLAVDAAARSVITGAGYPEYKHATGHQLGRLAAISDHESLSHWLREVLERLMDGASLVSTSGFANAMVENM